MIIEVDFKKQKYQANLIKKTGPVDGLYCGCRALLVDDHARTLTCRYCGKVIDAFDYVSSLATKETTLFSNIKQMQAEVRALSITVIQLKNEARRLKLRLSVGRKKTVVSGAAKKNVMEAGDIKEILNKIKEKLS